jgi:hypothetical protein
MEKLECYQYQSTSGVFPFFLFLGEVCFLGLGSDVESGCNKLYQASVLLEMVPSGNQLSST